MELSVSCIKVMQLAQFEAQKWQHDSVAPVHLLLGLVKSSDDASRFAIELKLDVEKLRTCIENSLQLGNAEPRMKPLSSETRQVISDAVTMARRCGDDHVLDAHLFWALLGDPAGMPCKIVSELLDNIVQLATIRSHLLGRTPALDCFTDNVVSLKKFEATDFHSSLNSRLRMIFGQDDKNSAVVILDPVVDIGILLASIDLSSFADGSAAEAESCELRTVSSEKLARGCTTRQYEERIRSLICEAIRERIVLAIEVGNATELGDPIDNHVVRNSLRIAADGCKLTRVRFLVLVNQERWSFLYADLKDVFGEHFSVCSFSSSEFDTKSLLPWLRLKRDELARRFQMGISNDALDAAYEVAMAMEPSPKAHEIAVRLIEIAARAKSQSCGNYVNVAATIGQEISKLEREKELLVTEGNLEEASQVRDQIAALRCENKSLVSDDLELKLGKNDVWAVSGNAGVLRGGKILNRNILKS